MRENERKTQIHIRKNFISIYYFNFYYYYCSNFFPGPSQENKIKYIHDFCGCLTIFPSSSSRLKFLPYFFLLLWYDICVFVREGTANKKKKNLWIYIISLQWHTFGWKLIKKGSNSSLQAEMKWLVSPTVCWVVNGGARRRSTEDRKHTNG